MKTNIVRYYQWSLTIYYWLSRHLPTEESSKYISIVHRTAGYLEKQNFYHLSFINFNRSKRSGLFSFFKNLMFIELASRKKHATLFKNIVLFHPTSLLVLFFTKQIISRT